MNLVQLRYAKLVAASGSFSAAARDAGVSQPTISNAISDLEGELGIKLFKRTTRRVELTALGKDMVRYIEGVLNSVRELELQVEAYRNPRRKLLRVAFSPLLDSGRLMALFEPFKRRHADVEIIYKECGVQDLETRLDNEQVDIICGIRLRTGANRKRCELYRDVLRYLPRGGLETYGGPQRVTPEDIARDLLILTVGTCGLAPATRALFRRGKRTLHEYPGQALSYHVLQEWSHLGVGAAILPESRIAGDAQAYPMVVAHGKPMTITYEAVWDSAVTPSTQVQAFAKYLKGTVSALTKGGHW